MNYNRKKAVEYAKIWWNKRNPKFYNFDNIGGDCTNFISQCLYAGEIKMNEKFWFYYSLNSRSPSWTGVNEFYNFCVNNKSEYGPKAKVVSLQQIEVGDIVQICQNKNVFHHSLLIVDIIGEKSLQNILIACHSNDEINKRLSDFNIKKIRFLKIQ